LFFVASALASHSCTFSFYGSKKITVEQLNVAAIGRIRDP